ncbi:MAG: glycosyltransferase, partial [Armatimonadota bacterium]
MRILHLIKTVSTGGAELHLLRLCRRLKADGIDVVVACLREAVPGTRSLRPDFERGGIRVIDLETAGGRGFLLAWALPRLLRDEHPDILHTHLPRADLAGAFGRWRVPVPWVVTVHGIYETHWSGRHLLPVFDRLWRRADALICTSEAVRTWLVGSRGLPSAKACVVHHGIETEVFREAGTDFRAAWGLDGRPIIGTVGRMEPGKGHDVLIRGMAEVVRDVPEALLLIAGPDPWGYRVRLEALVGSLNLNGHVRFVGFQQ